MGVAPPRPPAARRFGLLDAMILVGSVAVGLAALRAIEPDTDWADVGRAMTSKFAWDREYFGQVVPELIVAAMPPAITTSLGLLALMLRKPRPRWRVLRRRPGLVACLAVVLSWPLALSFLAAEVMLATSPPIAPVYFVHTFLFVASALGGFAVIVAWATLALIGRWRPEPTWPDRLGRLAGASWIALASAGGGLIRYMHL